MLIIDSTWQSDKWLAVCVLVTTIVTSFQTEEQYVNEISQTE